MSILKEGKPVGLACDHAGYEMKQIVMQELDVRGIAYKDFEIGRASCRERV